MTKTRHYSENHNMGVDGYIMFSFFSFTDGKLNIGQSQSVAMKDVALEREALARNGWTRAGYKYVNGKAVLVEAA
jgi:hypothetical protein